MPTTPLPSWREIMADGVITAALTSGLHPSPELKAFREEYTKQLQSESTPFAETSYDSIMMLAEVITKANSTTPAALQKEFNNTKGLQGHHWRPRILARRTTLRSPPTRSPWSNTRRRPRSGSSSRLSRLLDDRGGRPATAVRLLMNSRLTWRCPRRSAVSLLCSSYRHPRIRAPPAAEEFETEPRRAFHVVQFTASICAMRRRAEGEADCCSSSSADWRLAPSTVSSEWRWRSRSMSRASSISPRAS